VRNTTGTIWKAIESGFQWYPDFLDRTKDKRSRHTEKSHLTLPGRWAARPPTWQTCPQGCWRFVFCFVGKDGVRYHQRFRSVNITRPTTILLCALGRWFVSCWRKLLFNYPQFFSIYIENLVVKMSKSGGIELLSSVVIYHKSALCFATWKT